MNISGPAAVAKPEMLFYAPGDLTVTKILLICLISVLFFRTTERVSFWPYFIRQQLVLSIEKMHKVSETFSFKINETAAFLLQY